MGKMFILSNTAISDKTDRDLMFVYKVAGFAEDTWDYQNIFPVLHRALPPTLTMKPTKDLVLSKEEIIIIRDTCTNALLDLIKNKQEYPEGTPGDIQMVLGKNIRVHLKDPQDKIIHTFLKIYEIAEDCLQEEKPMYFSVIDSDAA